MLTEGEWSYLIGKNILPVFCLIANYSVVSGGSDSIGFGTHFFISVL
jgi:hypothetical protein